MPELQGAISNRIMKSFVIVLVFIILSLFLSGCENRKPEIEIPDLLQRTDVLQKFIDPLSEKYELKNLKEEYLTDDDLEVRVWLTAFDIDGFILKRINKKWSAIAIKEIRCGELNGFQKNNSCELGKINLSEPKSGWENMWQKLSETGILDLPSSDDVSYLDGVGYIVETNQNGKYRVYFYSNPQHQKTDEAKRMIKIGEIIADEFNLKNFKISSS